MDGDAPSQPTAQLDTAEREQLEAVVAEMRDRVEDNVRFQLTQRGLDEGSAEADDASLVEAIELEAVDGHDWADGVEQYVTGVGYTIVNRLAALRCLEVRGFVDEEITVFKPNGLTPAAETLVHEEFLLEDEAILEAYHRECDRLAAEIEILFDRSSAYSLLDPDEDTFEALAEEIAERCRAVHDRLPADWADRARAEVTTAGYRPIHKHGVEINIAPLADADIVPKTVDDDVL